MLLVTHPEVSLSWGWLSSPEAQLGPGSAPHHPRLEDVPRESQPRAWDAYQWHSKKVLSSNGFVSGTIKWTNLLFLFLSHFYNCFLTSSLCSLVSPCTEGKPVFGSLPPHPFSLKFRLFL